MSVYTDLSLIVSPVGDRRYRTLDPIRWELGRLGSGLWVEVPKGSIFDVSVPWLLTGIFRTDDERYFKAAALHDHLLALGWDRITAGAVFHHALKADGVSLPRRLSMWLAVSIWKFS